MAYEFKSNIIYETIEVDVLYEGNIITNRKFSTTIFTEDSAIEALQNEADNFGFFGLDNTLYPAAIKTPEPEPPVNPLQENVDSVTDKLSQLNETMSPDMFNINIEFMSDEDILKKMIMTQSSSIPEERINEKTADQIVESYPNNHPTKSFIKEKKKEVKDSTKQLGIKGKEITDGITQLTIETISAFVTIGSSAAIMPPGAGIPTAFSAVQGLFASLKAFQTKLNQLQPILKPLKYIEMLVPEGNPAVSSINTALGSLNSVVSGISKIITPIGEVQKLLNGTKVPGVNSPPTAIEEPVLLWGNNASSITPGSSVWIGSNAKGGTWQYKYWWTSDNDPAVKNANTKAVNVKPTVTTKYSVSVSNKDGTGETSWGSWTVTVNN